MDVTKLTKEELRQLVWLMDNCSSTYSLYGEEFYEKVLEELEIRDSIGR